jgi:hypothetical protein
MVAAAFRDVRFAFRTIRMAPGVSIVSILMLALGIAATAVAFSLIDAVLLKPLTLMIGQRCSGTPGKRSANCVGRRIGDGQDRSFWFSATEL